MWELLEEEAQVYGNCLREKLKYVGTVRGRSSSVWELLEEEALVCVNLQEVTLVCGNLEEEALVCGHCFLVEEAQVYGNC